MHCFHATKDTKPMWRGSLKGHKKLRRFVIISLTDQPVTHQAQKEWVHAKVSEKDEIKVLACEKDDVNASEH